MRVCERGEKCGEGIVWIGEMGVLGLGVHPAPGGVVVGTGRLRGSTASTSGGVGVRAAVTSARRAGGKGGVKAMAGGGGERGEGRGVVMLGRE